MVLDDRFLAPPPSLTLPVEPPPSPEPSPPPPEPSSPPVEIPLPVSEPPHTDVLLQQVLDALSRQATLAAPCAPAAEDGQRDLLQKALEALSAPADNGQVTAPADTVPVTAVAESVPVAPAELPPVPPPEVEMVVPAAVDEDEDVLVLDDSFVVAVVPPPEPPPVDMTMDEMAGLIAAATPDGAGTLDLPDRIDALAKLLLTPSDDFTAQDLLHDCWPRGSANVTSRALLAVAVNLSRNFGLPGKLPMAASKAWRMLDPQVFQAALAQRLAAIADFIFAWQRSQFTFLSLEFGEVELIEYLFESLHPGQNTELLASVMTFKVLSGRRIGLLRRIPGHARRAVEEMKPKTPDQALGHLAHVRSLLVRLAQSDGFPPIVEAAARSLAEVEKLMAQIANPQPPPPADGRRPGLPLGKI